MGVWVPAWVVAPTYLGHFSLADQRLAASELPGPWVEYMLPHFGFFGKLSFPPSVPPHLLWYYCLWRAREVISFHSDNYALSWNESTFANDVIFASLHQLGHEPWQKYYHTERERIKTHSAVDKRFHSTLSILFISTFSPPLSTQLTHSQIHSHRVTKCPDLGGNGKLNIQEIRARASSSGMTVCSHTDTKVSNSLH